MYAIIESGGKQYTVIPGQVIDVDHIDTTEGSSVELDKILLFNDEGKITVGKPTVEGAKVMATAQGDVKGDKLTIFTYRAKKRYSKKTGYRHTYTRLLIDKIIGPGGEAGEEAPKKPRRRKKAEVEESGS